ncbi:hypothetical protein DP107_08030 [Haloglomus irregulare]|uniref:Uncharacterized protein n=1 Tax=Haloglomus irregulare TaxID=2234134 RepID=A0A554NA09_9EURY|nr:hypothetical protein [Haloglomus irregulare]TSD14195.1 hypothetical protein DP107_08030 [Haloglomus irregulare]
MSYEDPENTTGSGDGLGRRNVLRTAGVGLVSTGLLPATGAARDATVDTAAAPTDGEGDPSPTAVLTLDPSAPEPDGTVTLDGPGSSRPTPSPTTRERRPAGPTAPRRRRRPSP